MAEKSKSLPRVRSEGRTRSRHRVAERDEGRHSLQRNAQPSLQGRRHVEVDGKLRRA